MGSIHLPYRLRQVVHHQVRHEDIVLPEDAKNRLTPPMEHQFRILSPADQKHLVNVYVQLVKMNADDDTVTAGLIHDVGKACAKCRITVVDRGLHVILSRFAGPLYRRFAKIEVAPEFARGLHRLANHAERGALAATQAGYNDRVAELIRYHESSGSRDDAQLRMLRYADDTAERA